MMPRTVELELFMTRQQSNEDNYFPIFTVLAGLSGEEVRGILSKYYKLLNFAVSLSFFKIWVSELNFSFTLCSSD